MPRQQDPTLPELPIDSGLPEGGVAPKKRDFLSRLKDVLSKVTAGATDLTTGDVPSPDTPVSAMDVMSSQIQPNAHPHGFFQNLAEISRKRGEARLGTEQARSKQATETATRGKIQAETTATEALAGQRDSQRVLNEATTRSKDLESQIKSAETPAKLQILQGRVEELKASVDDKIAEAKLAVTRAQGIGDETTLARKKQELAELTQAQKYYVDLQDLAVKKQNADTGTTNAATNRENVAGQNRMRQALGALYGVQATREQGKAMGSTPEGKAEIAKMESETGLNAATANARLDGIDTKNELAVMTELKAMKALGYSDDSIDQALRVKQEEGDLSPAIKPERGGFVNWIKKSLGAAAAGPAASTPAPSAAAGAPTAAAPAPAVPQGTIRVKNKLTGQTGTMPADKFDPAKYDKLP